jgi:hypothetical protein
MLALLALSARLAVLGEHLRSTFIAVFVLLFILLRWFFPLPPNE